MKKIPSVILAVLTVLSFGFGTSACRRTESGSVEPITLGKMPIAAHLLIYIAEEQGFFSKNGIAVAVRDFDTGPEALRAMFAENIDIAHAGEYAAVASILKDDDLRILASIDRYRFFHLAARKDRGVRKASDLRGKKIGVSPATSGEFFLGRFLQLQGLSLSDITAVDIRPPEFVQAISDGSVDAVVYIRPYDKEIRQKLGADGVFWDLQGTQDLYSVMVARREWTSGHPETLKRLLKSLLQAEKHLIAHPAQGKETLRRALDLDASYVEETWTDHLFSLTLDQSLVVAMEHEARWMIKNRNFGEVRMPNLSDYIYGDALEAVKPTAVNIIR
ncbi:MAG: hypothetical protein C4530_04795 [Desulfobacteraceae bacterium]|nr:MAG: hypothetical protein C4530_04795 [Desulfobacteraceae bacterium]